MMKRLLQLFCILLCFQQANHADVIWNTPEGVPTTAMPSSIISDLSVPQIGVDADGNAHAIWVVGDDIRIAKFVICTNTWTIEEDFMSGFNSYRDPVIAVNASGEAIAAWVRDTMGPSSIRASYYDGTSWSAIETPEVSTDFQDNVAVAIDPDGNAYAIWTVDTPIEVRASKRTPGALGTWSDISTGLPSKLLGLYDHTTIGVDGSGNAIAAWNSTDGTTSTVEAYSFPSAGPSWSSIGFTEAQPAYKTISDVKVVVNESGNAALAWGGEFMDSSRSFVAYHLDTIMMGFEDKMEFSVSSASVIVSFDIAIDPTGDAVFVFNDLDSFPFSTTYFSTYASGAWSSKSILATNTGLLPRIGLDSSGNGVALVATLDDPIYPTALFLVASSFTKATTSWSATEQVSSDTIFNIFQALGVAANGNAIGIWSIALDPYDPYDFTVESNYGVATSTVVAVPDTVAADGIASSTITVTVKDSCGNPIEGVSVTLAKDSATAMIMDIMPVTNAMGIATFSTTDTVEEVVTYTATAGGVEITQTAMVTFTGVPPPPSGGSFNLGSVVIFVRSLLMPGYVPMAL